MEFYRKVMTGRGANGTEGIVHVEVTVLEDYFIIYPMKACIINCQQLMPRRLPDNNTNLPTIHQNCQYMLLLPDEFPRKNIKGIQAGLFDIKEKQLERLTLMGYEHVVEVFNHRCLPLEPTRIPKHVSKYSKTIQQIKSPTELSDQLFGVGGDHSSDKTRPEFVKLKFITADENAQRDVLEICDKGDVLYPRGILLHGKETKSKHNGKETKSKYNVKVIGSYSCKKGKITYKCILDKVINSGDEIDHGKEENASEHAKVNQANATNTNNPVLAAANNGLKGLGAEPVPSGSEEPGFQLEAYEREPHALGKKKPLDNEKPSSTQKEGVPIGVGATLSDRGNLQLDNQANANKTNKLGAVATNELNNTVGKTEGGRSGSSEQFDIDECEPCALGKNASKNVKHQTKVAIIQHDSSEKEVFNEDVNKYAASSFSDHSSCSDVDSSSSPVDKVSKLHKIREDIESQRDEVKNLLDPEIMTEVKDIVTSIKKDGKCQNSPTDDLLKELEKWYKLVEAKEDWSDTRNALQEREESHRLLDKRPFYDVGQQDLARKLIDDRCAHLLLLIDNQLRKPSAEFAV